VKFHQPPFLFPPRLAQTKGISRKWRSWICHHVHHPFTTLPLPLRKRSGLLSFPPPPFRSKSSTEKAIVSYDPFFSLRLEFCLLVYHTLPFLFPLLQTSVVHPFSFSIELFSFRFLWAHKRSSLSSDGSVTTRDVTLSLGPPFCQPQLFPPLKPGPLPRSRGSEALWPGSRQWSRSSFSRPSSSKMRQFFTSLPVSPFGMKPAGFPTRCKGRRFLPPPNVVMTTIKHGLMPAFPRPPFPPFLLLPLTPCENALSLFLYYHVIKWWFSFLESACTARPGGRTLPPFFPLPPLSGSVGFFWDNRWIFFHGDCS